MASKKNKQGDKLVTRKVFIDLKESEIMDKSKELGEMGVKLGQVEAEKRESMSNYGARITTLKDVMADYFKVLSERKEMRDVECVELKNFTDETVEYYFEGVKVDSRPLTEGDRQEELGL